jgi:hypothetical protein
VERERRHVKTFGVIIAGVFVVAVVLLKSSSGGACAVRGWHAWKVLPDAFPMGNGFYEVAQYGVEARECAACGKVQTRKVGGWR